MRRRPTRLPRREPLKRALTRGIGGGLFLFGGPVFVWVFAFGLGSEGGVEWHRAPRAIVVTALMVGLFGVLVGDLMRSQGILPLMRWRHVGDAWELRFANELLGWRAVATVRPGDTIEFTQRDNTPAWALSTHAVTQESPYRRCVVTLASPGVDTEVHVALPLHRRYVEQVQEAMKTDGLEVTLTFRNFVRPVSPYDAGPAELRGQ